jgi:hypothetical protein
MLRLLWGNLPMEAWPEGDEAAGGVVAMFVAARAAFNAGDVREAVRVWQQIADTEETESRNVLQAWTFLRANGVVPPPSVERNVLGVVVEMPVSGSRDVLAAYRNGSCRYLNHSGRVAVVDDALQADARAVTDVGQVLGQVLGTWDGAALPDLPRGHARLTLLTPAGFRFGQGPANVLLRDPNAVPVLDASAHLLAKVVELSQR